MALIQAIEHHYLVADCQQITRGKAAAVARAAGDKYFHGLVAPLWLLRQGFCEFYASWWGLRAAAPPANPTIGEMWRGLRPLHISPTLYYRRRLTLPYFILYFN